MNDKTEAKEFICVVCGEPIPCDKEYSGMCWECHCDGLDDELEKEALGYEESDG